MASFDGLTPAVVSIAPQFGSQSPKPDRIRNSVPTAYLLIWFLHVFNGIWSSPKLKVQKKLQRTKTKVERSLENRRVLELVRWKLGHSFEL